MINLDAMAAGARARLQHHVNVDVARHLREMFPPVVAKPSLRKEIADLMEIRAVYIGAGGSCGPATGTTTGGGSGGWGRGY